MLYSNFLIEQFQDRDTKYLLPANMSDAVLHTIAASLARWKQHEGDEEDRFVIESFASFWGSRLSTAKNLPLIEKFNTDKYGIIPVLAAMGELEFLVHQEIVSRRLGQYTYDPESILITERIKPATLDYLRLYLEHYLLGYLTQGNFAELAMPSISKFFEQ